MDQIEWEPESHMNSLSRGGFLVFCHQISVQQVFAEWLLCGRFWERIQVKIPACAFKELRMPSSWSSNTQHELERINRKPKKLTLRGSCHRSSGTLPPSLRKMQTNQ